MALVRPVAMDPVYAFRVDAKAEGEEIVIGGKSYDRGRTEKARWFSIRLNRKNAPWAYLKGEPYRNIAALELMVVLVALMLFGKDARSRNRRSCMRLMAQTDNVAWYC